MWWSGVGGVGLNEWCDDSELETGFPLLHFRATPPPFSRTHTLKKKDSQFFKKLWYRIYFQILFTFFEKSRNGFPFFCQSFSTNFFFLTVQLRI